MAGGPVIHQQLGERGIVHPCFVTLVYRSGGLKQVSDVCVCVGQGGVGGVRDWEAAMEPGYKK